MLTPAGHGTHCHSLPGDCLQGIEILSQLPHVLP